MRVLGLLIIRESTWLARERELQRAHVEATKRLLADLPQEARDRHLERSLGLHAVKLGPLKAVEHDRPAIGDEPATELERRFAEHADADGLIRLPTMTNEADPTGSWPATGRLLDSGPLPELVPGQFGERVKAEWLPWVRAAAEGASPDELRALEPPGFVAGEPMTMLEPDVAIVDRDPGDETGTG